MNRLRFPPLPEWSGRDDGLGPERFHQHVKAIPFEQVPFASGRQAAFIGFRCDEGVGRNKGRLGAAEGPEFLRKSLANLTWNLSKLPCIDVGDVYCTDRDLEGAQKELGELVSALLRKKYLPIVLGGGHETAWGHFQGIASVHKAPLIINFDAHYDMRPLVDGKWGSSGTPFLQIANFCEREKRPFQYLCIGVQSAANTDSLRKTAAHYKVHTVLADTLHGEGVSSTQALVKKALAACDSVYLSVCMDVFAQSCAPGVSAPQALGLTPWQVVPILRQIVQSGKLVSADFVELCPSHDQDFQTSKLGASLIWEVCS